jgi:hypothetical protein
MAVFQWVGGYTNHKGFLSGYSGNYKGSGKEVWESPWNGVTGMSGDRAFAPYYWGFTQNWLERTQNTDTSCSSPYKYEAASRLPRGGDTVVFGWKYDPCQIYPLTQRLRANISCLFGGGLSGASETWLGASTNTTGDIYVEILSEYGENSHPTNSLGFIDRVLYRFGPVGQGYCWGNWRGGAGPNSIEDPYQEMLRGRIGFDASQINLVGGILVAADFALTGDKNDGLYMIETDGSIDPLDLRFSAFNNNSTEARVCLRQRSESSETTLKQVNSYVPHSTVTVPSLGPSWANMGSTANSAEIKISGTVWTIEQDNGYVSSLVYKGSGLTATDIYITENLIGANFEEGTRILNSIACTPRYARESINIRCAAPSLVTEHNLNQKLGYPGSVVFDGVGAVTRAKGLTFNIGNRYGLAATESCTFTEWRIGFFGGTGINEWGEPTPKVNMFRLQADSLFANGGYMQLAPESVSMKPTFREGYMRNNAVLDLRNTTNNADRTGEIGLASGDEGLRMDSQYARIRFARGQNFIINGVGDPQGIT